MSENPQHAAFGVPGLDDVLEGGLPANRLYLVEGMPGAGKTTLALQFLRAGAACGEGGLYVTLSETAEELAGVVASHRWPPLAESSGIALFELASAESVLGPSRDMTLLHPWEVELGETIKLITDRVEQVGARRVVFDSMAEMRLLAQDPLRFRRQVLALKQYFAGRGITVLMLDDLSALQGERDLQLHSLAHGVIALERLEVDYGAGRRRLRVVKLRGARFRAGWHDYEIRTGGIDVFPRLVATEHFAPFQVEPCSSGNGSLDAMLGGGPLRGTSTLITGAPGTGKTTLALQFAFAAAERGERAVVYQFEERRRTLIARTSKLGMDLAPHLASTKMVIRQVDPVELSPGEFAAMVRDHVEGPDPARIVVIDSLNSYFLAMPGEKQLLLQMHELLAYMNQQGVTVILINPQQGVLGPMQQALNVSSLADVVILLRYFEAAGHIRKAISILKNRGGRHETTIREFQAGPAGVEVGRVLADFQGVLTGTPVFKGELGHLLGSSPLEPADGDKRARPDPD